LAHVRHVLQVVSIDAIGPVTAVMA
jgi:hypothetical protein